MTKRPEYKLRETIPNPAGGEWPQTTAQRDDAAIDLAINSLRTTMKHAILPRLMEVHEGNTKKVAMCMATLFVNEMREFFKDNRAEDQANTLLVYDEIISCFVYSAERMQGTAMLAAMGLNAEQMLKDGLDVHVIKI